MTVSPIPHEPTRFFVSSESRAGVDHVVDMAWQDEKWSKAQAVCSCEWVFCGHSKICKHIILVMKRTIEERLVTFLKLNELTGCWEFQGFLNNNGYGQVGFQGRRLIYAHRLAWLLWKGEIDNGLCVLHKCDTPKCCNPEHLFLGTIADNNADCLKKGRHISGFKIHRERSETIDALYWDLRRFNFFMEWNTL